MMQVRPRVSPRRGSSRPAAESLREGRSGDRGVASLFLEQLHVAEAEMAPSREALLSEIDKAGRRLADNPTLAHLQEYRRQVASLLKALQRDAVRVVTEGVGTSSGRRRLLVLVRVINQELEELARMILAREKDRLAIVAKLDQLRGLLLDLYR